MPEREYPPLTARAAPLPVTSTVPAIPHPLDGKWEVSVDDTTYGPFTGHELKEMTAEGRLEYDSLVRKAGSAAPWTKASDERALAKFFIPQPTSMPPKVHAVSAGDRAQIVTVNNNISTQPMYLGEAPVDKGPFIAAILSLLIVGVGQMYNGQVGKGILMMIGCVLLWTVMLGWIINIWSIIDAYSTANRKHDAFTRWKEASAATARANL